MLKNKPMLLAVMGVLLLIRFGILPLLSWQNDAISELEVLSTQYVKVNALLSKEPLLQQTYERLQANKSEFQANVQKAKDPQSLALVLQTQFEQIARQQTVEVDLFNWITQKQEISPDIYSAKVTARFSGSYPNVGKTLLNIEKQTGIYLNDIRFDWRNNFAPTTATFAEVEFFVVYQEDES